ncbi:hypothetical protein [Nocardiopsis kunsanensis]|uniref:Uncharacterized protein n=1 Tax=Nocardiopsis kunsanensis TaxID=141693 RepID=A0A919CFG6_9ACTN|nr:hypothetical protein [Nocardiopsis kunsanensis]GHD18332.1 hypothetical protein GCM10007147_08330 [Nocardiopsis kunsanensis]
MNTLSGDTTSQAIEGCLRPDLDDLDRLRAVWAEHRGPRGERARARRESAHRRSYELGGGPALAELLEATASEEMSGRAITSGYVTELAERAASLPDPVRCPRLTDEHAADVARAASAPGHPAVRAVHAYVACAEALHEAAPGRTGGDPGWVLPWILASLVLQRADFPPLLPDPGVPACTEAGGTRRIDLCARHLSRLVAASLRTELSRSRPRPSAARVSAPPLAAAVHRRALEHLHERRGPLLQVLTSLDTEARADVRVGSAPQVPQAVAAPPERALLAPEADHWWVCLSLIADEAALELYVVVQEVGPASAGVLAVTADARLTTGEGVHGAPLMADVDGVTVMPNDSADDRRPLICDLIDEALSRSMALLTRV